VSEVLLPTETIKRHRSARFVLPSGMEVPTLPAIVTLTDPTIAHHAATVLRLKPTTYLTVIHTGLEASYLAKVSDLSTKHLTLEILSQDDAVLDGLPHITLMAALIKGQRWDWLLQKATELGVRSIQPLVTQRTVVKTKEWKHKLPRWQEITRAAVEQCDGRFLPTLLEPQPLTQACQELKAQTLKLVMMERGDGRVSLAQALAKHCATAQRLPNALCMAVGPEGGFTPDELATLIAEDFQPIHYGRRILKAETAAIAGVAGVIALYDDEAPYS